MDKTAFAINITTAGSALSQTTIDTWRGEAATARTNVGIVVSNLLAADEKLKTAESNFSLANQELVLKKAGATNEQIQAQEAQVEKAEANVLSYRAQLSKTILRSPINGVVTRQNAKVGEIISANSVLVSIISEFNFEIEVDVPEVDVAKLELGDTAKATLDAYGDDEIFTAIVVAIDPAETFIEGVPSYKTTLQFKEENGRIRSGMTANLDILTDKKVGVIVIPQRAVIAKNGSKFVRVVVKEDIIEKEIKTGLRGSYGNIEVLEGLSEGEKVITFMR